MHKKISSLKRNTPYRVIGIVTNCAKFASGCELLLWALKFRNVKHRNWAVCENGYLRKKRLSFISLAIKYLFFRKSFKWDFSDKYSPASFELMRWPLVLFTVCIPLLKRVRQNTPSDHEFHLMVFVVYILTGLKEAFHGSWGHIEAATLSLCAEFPLLIPRRRE